MTLQAPSPAERVFSLLELCEPILSDLPIQDLIRSSHISRASLNTISSSKPLRSKLLCWRKCDLNMLALMADYFSFPTGFVSCYDFDAPGLLRLREAPWIFHTVVGCQKYEEEEEEEEVCSEEEEYFVHVPFSMEERVRALRLAGLVFDHEKFMFVASWVENFGYGDTKTILTQAFRGRGYMFEYFQTWYTMDSARVGSTLSSSKEKKIIREEKTATRNAVDWKRWAQINGGEIPAPLPVRRGWKTWLQRKGWRGRTTSSEKISRNVRRTDVEDLDLDFSGSMPEVSNPPVEEVEFINRHGHIRDGYQTDLRLHLQRSYILKYSNYICDPQLNVCATTTSRAH
ncbi:hypothetical protein BST61_g3242 [Cercospora zeina]